MRRALCLFLFSLLSLLIGLASCTPSQPAPVPATIIPPSHLPSQAATRTPSAIQTLEPTLDQNALLATNQAESLSKFATSKAVLTQLAFAPSATPRPISSPTTIPTPFPTSTPIADDTFVREMSEKGYSIWDAGSIQDGAYTYHAYLFREPKENANDRTMDVIRETWIIAFYREDGEKNELMGTFYPASWSKHEPDDSYPIFYRLINWDDPARSFLGLEWVFDPDEETRVSAGLNHFASDINHNGRPEFDFVAQYCPVSCSQPAGAYHFFEITETGKVIDLAAGLPGHLDFQPYSVDPVVYEINERYGYGYFGFYNYVYIPRFYEWQNDQFVDVTLQYKNTILESWNERISALKTQYGLPFYVIANEITLVSIPMIYQSLGMGSDGLTLFLEISDPLNWPNMPLNDLCWLQYVRAHFQDAFAQNLPFTVPTASSDLTGLSTEYLQRMISPFNPETYDLTACYALLPDE